MKVYTKVVFQMTDVIGEYIPIESHSFNYDGPVDQACDMFGGPSAQEKSTLGQQSGLSTALLSSFNQQYAQQQSVLKQLGGQVMRLQSGQTGPGFSGAENAARISLIQNTGAARARNAIQAQRSLGAGTQSDSGLGRESGIQQQVAGGIEALAGADTSNALLSEQAQNYDQGRSNAVSSASALNALAGQYNPSAYSGQAGQSLGAQFSQAHTINQENIARSQAISGLITKGITGAATFGLSGIANLGAGESVGEGFGDFFKGGVNALAG